ncbi:MAG: hypothetical protein ABEI54_04425, partial [Candidatus Bipolaricaulia bacterium]
MITNERQIGGGSMARKLLRVNMEKEKLEFEELPEAYRSLGGRGL